MCNHKPSFVFLIEMLSFSNKVEEMRFRLGFEHCFSVDRVGRSGGLAILWKNKFNCEILSYSKNHSKDVVVENNILLKIIDKIGG